MTEEEIVQAIPSFLNGSAGEPDGLHPQHLKNLISVSVESGGKELLWALMSFVNLVLNGRAPSVCPVLFGATLIPLGKKGGGIKPIAVAHILQCLVAKCASSIVLPAMGHGLQLGCRTPSGFKAEVHATHLYIHHMTAGHVLLKVDFKNAFNIVRYD